ncbi:TetR/AcrR family transcriptional regulator [Granulosicoccus antarcticus]|uniref:HTH tetR-type domain-containing protein n=1 Tax=Granulosicoccus antarcticus IMCC3135 TaxID=1192854 RepID=A0A2Z2P4P5_9GAMM|nr:TetR/AcrR family transcriptional regulator [Granulosicoccus antarcticus]ASJ74804.1 hypothetical protein IMCC3135_23675 [Granulosicoccus antarcticus IMCC3135]
MGRRSDHSREELQTLIVESTLALVKEHGASNVTARQIAKAVGYTPGMLYSIFLNLQDIFQHVNQVGLHTLYKLCEASQKNTEGPEDAIKAMGMAYLQFAAQHTHQFDLMFARSLRDAPASPSSLSNQIQVLFQLVEAQLRTLKPGATEAQLQLGARALWSGVHGTAALRLSNQLYIDTPNADQEIVDILVSSFVNQWCR